MPACCFDFDGSPSSKTKPKHKLNLKTLLTTALIALASIGFAADKPYPLNTCIVSDNKLGSMGKIIVKSHEGQQIKFCCKPCVKKFDANPAKYLAKLKK